MRTRAAAKTTMPNRFLSAAVTMPVIMVVDDQAANVQVLGQLLTHADYDVVPVLDGAEALALAEHSPPDLVLLDMRMPGLDGFGVLEGLQAMAQTRHVPVVFLTADHERDSLVRAFSAGAVDYITKPFIAEELLARVRTHLDLKRSRERLARVAEERQRMAEIVSHDLRNHFGNILFSLDMLRELGIDDTVHADQRARLLDSIRASADAGLLFVSAFLDQQQDAAQGVPVAEADAGALARAAIELMMPQAARKGVKLTLAIEDHALRVLAERAGAGHVLQNLLSNAIKYGPPDGEVVLSVTRRGNMAALAVHDRGPGIAAQDRERLFRRFVRLGATPTGGETSTGLGLALAKQRARAMGGDLWYEARPGGGASFVFELPLA
jgi:two-component system sensor histidine kinase/response regulator